MRSSSSSARFGKTSILRGASERLTQSGAVVIRLNAEAFPTVDLLVGKLTARAAVKLKDRLETGIEQLGRFFSHLRPEFKYGGVNQELSVSIGVDSSAAESRPVKPLADALDGLEKPAKTQPRERPVGLIIDEFQAVVARGIDPEAQIRSAIQEHERVGYVFAGSPYEELSRKHRRSAEKCQIVELTMEPGATVSLRAHGINANQLFEWRRSLLVQMKPISLWPRKPDRLSRFRCG